jgi:hypothetical protein
MENWSEEIITSIDVKLTGAREKDLRFFRIEEFKRNIQRTDAFARQCSYCREQKPQIEKTISSIGDAVQIPGKARRNYDRLISRLASHMQNKHGFYAPYYFTYLYSFFGMLAGLVSGYLLMKLFSDQNWMMLSAGFVAGLFAGYSWGSIKDKKIRKEKRLM